MANAAGGGRHPGHEPEGSPGGAAGGPEPRGGGVRLARVGVDWLYPQPPLCLICRDGRLSWRSDPLCAECLDALPRLVEPLCEQCGQPRSEEHTSELQSRENLVCRLLLEKKK